MKSLPIHGVLVAFTLVLLSSPPARAQEPPPQQPAGAEPITLEPNSPEAELGVDNNGSVGWFTSITIGTDGLPVISYYDVTNTDLKVLHCGNAACTSGNVSRIADAGGDLGQHTSITIGADGLPVVSYYDATHGDLKVLHCGNVFCTPYFRRR